MATIKLQQRVTQTVEAEPQLRALSLTRGDKQTPTEIIALLQPETDEGVYDESIDPIRVSLSGKNAEVLRQLILDSVAAGPTAEAMKIAGVPLRRWGFAELLKLGVEGGE